MEDKADAIQFRLFDSNDNFIKLKEFNSDPIWMKIFDNLCNFGSFYNLRMMRIK